MGKLFGTDGIRGVVNEGLDAELAYQVGLAAARVLGEAKGKERPLFTIGKDTRISSDLLESALIAGLCSAGADVLRLGVIPTPGVAYLTIHAKADAGIVISASHNPFEHNGIKIFNGQGFKLSDALEEQIEAVIFDGCKVARKTHGELGRVRSSEFQESEAYINHLSAAIDDDLHGLRILVDCANGAASATAKRLFEQFSAKVDIINNHPDGVNINNRCGSTHLDLLSEKVVEGKYDVGIAFDGDADRCLAVDETGETIDGDQIMAICGAELKKAGKLNGDTIVATVMSNIGFHIFAKEHGIQVPCTDVGDRNVLETMLEHGYRLGGEQSGHTIFLEYATTGDGQLTALQFLQVLRRSGQKASELASCCKRYPQFLINVPVAGQEEKNRIMSGAGLKAETARQEERLCGEGRILIRPSGTEALIRVMVEGKDPEKARNCAEELAEFVRHC